MSSKNNSRYQKSDTITMGEFWHNYLGMPEHDCSNLRHMGLKSMEIPYVVGVSNDFADSNPDLVLTGDILIVMDSRNHKGTYINPKILLKLENKEELIEAQRLLYKIRIHELKNLTTHYGEIVRINYELDKITEYEEMLTYLGKEKTIRRMQSKNKQMKRG